MKKIFNKLKLGRGFVLVTSLLAMMVLLLMTVYLINFSISESKISLSQGLGVQDYYLAEAGIQEAIWHLQYDNNWKNQFEINPSWSFSFTRNNNLINGGSYTIGIQNTALASGEITSTSTLTDGQKSSQRAVKIKAFKALNPSANPLGETTVYCTGNLELSNTVFNIIGGNLYSNGNIDLKLATTVNLNSHEMLTSQNVIKSCLSRINNATAIKANQCTGQTSWPCTSYNPACSSKAPDAPLPMINFDSDGPDSYKSKATSTYSESEFADLIWNNQNLTLDGIIYVNGNINFNGPRNMTLNGVLVAIGDINIGQEWCLKRGPIGNWKCGNPTITVNHTAGQPSGLLAKNKMSISSYTNSINVNGLVYALDQMNISSLANTFNIVGGLYSRKITASSLWRGLNLTYNENTVSYTIAEPSFSPTVTVEHWEEEY